MSQSELAAWLDKLAIGRRDDLGGESLPAR